MFGFFPLLGYCFLCQYNEICLSNLINDSCICNVAAIVELFYNFIFFSLLWIMCITQKFKLDIFVIYISSDILSLEIDQYLVFIRHMAISKNVIKGTDVNISFVKQALWVPDLRPIVPPQPTWIEFYVSLVNMLTQVIQNWIITHLKDQS